MSRVQTVLGGLPPDKLGITLPHEHLLLDIEFCVLPEKQTLPASYQSIINAPITIENLAFLRRNPNLMKENLRLCDINVASEELRAFKRAGGSSLVEVTPRGLGRDPIGLKQISVDTGVNIICATGWYRAPYRVGAPPPGIKNKSIDELSEIMVKEISDGIVLGGVETGIRPGIIKCGCSSSLHPEEKKVLQAAARAQIETGVPITIHTDGYEVTPPWTPSRVLKKLKVAHEYIEILEKEGAKLAKCNICHMDLTCEFIEYHIQLIDKYGVFLSYDGFGQEFYHDTRWPGAGPISDRQRVEGVMKLCEQGYDKNLMLSQDVCWKMFLAKYGGYGYAHVLRHIVPELKFRGVKDTQIKNMIIDNPKSFLSY